MKSYYEKTQQLARVDETGRVIGEIDKWEAHKNGILHKGFSVALFSNNQITLQVRKHPVFDGVVDVTASSHPEMINGKMEDEKGTIIKCLKREWHISEKEIGQLNNLGSIYYKAKDNAGFIEHEYCTFYGAKAIRNVTPDPEFAYGFVQVDLEFLKKNPQSFNLASWVKVALNKNLLVV